METSSLKQEPMLYRRDTDSDNVSTVSGNSLMLQRPAVSAFGQAKYLDEIETILRRKRRQKQSSALKFLNTIQAKKSEAIA